MTVDATATYLVERLPATKTDPRPGIRWQPSADPSRGILTVYVRNKPTRYEVTEFRCDLPGRAFRLEKLDGGTDAEADAYCVFVANDPTRHSCECKGHHRHGHCKHISAIVDGLLFNRWM